MAKTSTKLAARTWVTASLLALASQGACAGADPGPESADEPPLEQHDAPSPDHQDGNVIDEKVVRDWWNNTREIGDSEGPHRAPDELIDVNYRGRPVTVERYGSLLLLEGDVQVTSADIEDEHGEGELVQKGVSRQGRNFQWPGGVVPFRFGTYNNIADDGTLSGSLSTTQRGVIEDALDELMALVPGLTFRPRVASDANFITFNLSSVCSSSIGRAPGDSELGNAALPGEQIIRLSAGCVNRGVVQHEVAHALGVHHEQTRKDRDSFVRVNWGNVQGCPNNATSAADCDGCPGNPQACGCTQAQVNNNTCRRAHNFGTDNARSNLFGYDYESVMHYGVREFAKSGAGDSLTVLKNDPQTGAPYAVGQRSRVSNTDVAVLRALYPVMHVHDVLFARTGKTTLCRFDGRAEDANTNYSVSGGIPSSAMSGALVDTNKLTEGSYTVTCSATSAFWSQNYDYPAYTRTINPSNVSSSNRETYTASNVRVRVLNPGLIATLF